MRTRVRLNGRELDRILNGSEADELLRGPAERALAAAKASAPVASGAYVDSLHIEVDNTDRRRYRIVADVSYALAVEARTGNLARAQDAAR